MLDFGRSTQKVAPTVEELKDLEGLQSDFMENKPTVVKAFEKLSVEIIGGKDHKKMCMKQRIEKARALLEGNEEKSLGKTTPEMILCRIKDNSEAIGE